MAAAPVCISVLSEDEADADGESVEEVIARLKDNGKRMRPVGRRVVSIGKQSMDHMQHVMEEEEKEVQAFSKASAEYHATMEKIHNTYAVEIKSREDALAAATAQKAKEASEAKAEIDRLQGLLAEQQKQAVAELAKVQAEAESSKRAALAKAAASEAALKKQQKTAPSLLSAKDSLEMIIADVMQSYRDKRSAFDAGAAPTQAPAAAGVPKPVASLWLSQKNTNPSYLTVREVWYINKKWYFDGSDKRGDPAAAANPIEITDAAAITALAGLGSFTAVRKAFKPKVGNKVTYTYNSHTYEVEVVRSVKPWEEAVYQQKPGAPALASSTNVNHHMLLEGPFFSPSAERVNAYGDRLDTMADQFEVTGHKDLADLATHWSSYSQKFKYDAATTELWVKPKWLATWLNTLKHSDHEVRIVAHGVRSGDFSSLAQDPRGFNLAMCNKGRAKGDGSQGYGIYVSPLDCIPADYTNVSMTQKDGTFVLGLLQVPKPSSSSASSSASTHPTGTSSAAYQTQNGALEFYHLGSSRPHYLAQAPTENDAYNVRDQTLFLALGKVSAM